MATIISASGSGSPGSDGRTVLNGSGAPSGATGETGDFYIDTDTDEIYGPKSGSTWGSGTSLGGSTILNGSGAPSGATGVTGDFYIDTTADAIYGPKVGSTWGGATSLIGPTGAGSTVIVEEIDGTPSVNADTIRFTNGTVTDDGGGQVTVTIGSSGAPSDAEYLVETANGNLSAEVVTGTTFITTAAYGSRQAAAKSGRLFLPNNSFYIERDTGSAWAPWGPLYPFTIPIDGDFTWINQGGASVEASKGAIYILAPAGAGTNLRIRKKAAPATPYTITTAIEPAGYGVASAAYGVMFRQSSDGKIHALSMQHSGSALQIFSLKYSDASTFSASYADSPQNLYTYPKFLRIADNGTNRIVSWSMDGQHFQVFHTIGRTDFLTADEVGFFVQSANASFDSGATLLSWSQT